jgi:Retroviral aspartyl protease
MVTTEQLNTILERLTSRNHKSGTRKMRAFSPVQSDTEDVHMFGPKTKVGTNKYSDEDSIYLGLNPNCASSFHYDENSPKRQKLCHKTTEVMRQVHGTDSDGILRILLDTGASATIILKDAIRGLTGPVLKEQPTKWTAVGGQFVTHLQREVKCTLPESSTSKVIQWICHEDSNTLRKNAQYDMIIGADLLSELGIELNFSTQRIIWEGIEIPMKDKHVISHLQSVTAVYYQSIEPTVFREAEA